MTTRYRLTEPADLGVIFDAEILLYADHPAAHLPGIRQRFIAHYSGCRSVGFEIDGVAVGGAIYDGEEFHIAVLPAYLGRWTWLLKPTLHWLFTQADPAIGRIARSNRRALHFADKTGFPRRVREDALYITYELRSENLHHLYRHRGQPRQPVPRHRPVAACAA